MRKASLAMAIATLLTLTLACQSPAPTTTPAQTAAATAPQPAPTESATQEPDQNISEPVKGPLAADSLSNQEVQCLEKLGKELGSRDAEIIEAIQENTLMPMALECITDQSISRMAASATLKDSPTLQESSVSCMADNGLAQLVKEVYATANQADRAEAVSLALLVATSITAAHCLTSAEWAEAGMSEEQRKTLTCMQSQGATPHASAKALMSADPAAVQEIEDASRICQDQAGASSGTDRQEHQQNPAKRLARDTAASTMNLTPAQAATMNLLEWKPVTWPDRAMGCQQGNQQYAQVETRGHVATWPCSPTGTPESRSTSARTAKERSYRRTAPERQPTPEPPEETGKHTPESRMDRVQP